MFLPSDGQLSCRTMRHHITTSSGAILSLLPRFDEHMRRRWLSALRCQTGPSSTNCPLAVLIIFWHNQLGWECASLRQRSLPKCYHQCKAASPSLSGEMPSFFAQIETRLYNMLAIHKLSPTRLCSGLVHVFFLVLLLCLFSVGHYLATKKRGRKKKILWVSLTCILSVGLFEGKANCYASEVHC